MIEINDFLGWVVVIASIAGYETHHVIKQLLLCDRKLRECNTKSPIDACIESCRSHVSLSKFPLMFVTFHFVSTRGPMARGFTWARSLSPWGATATLGGPMGTHVVMEAHTWDRMQHGFLRVFRATHRPTWRLMRYQPGAGHVTKYAFYIGSN